MRVMATIYKKRIKVEFPYDPMMVSAIKEVPGSKFTGRDKGGPFWTVPLDFDSAKMLRNVFGEHLRISKELKEWGWKIVKEREALNQIIGADDVELEKLPLHAPEMAEGLRPFQRVGVKFGATSSHPLIGDQPGLGKTREAIGAVLEAGLTDGPYLVIAPKSSLRTVWEDHLVNVLDRNDEVLVATGSRSKRLETLDLAAEMIENGVPVWVIINPEMVRQRAPKSEVSRGEAEPNSPAYPLLHDTHWQAVIIDEVHRGAVRNPQTQTAKSLYKIKADKRIALSGTPVKNRPIDIWGTLHWLNPDVFSSKWRWAEQYLHIKNNGFGSVFCSGRTDSGSKCQRCEGGIRNDAIEAFHEHLKPYLLRRTKAEVYPDLPPKEYVDVWCDMTPKQKKLYDEFAKRAEAVIGDETVSATNVLAELTRLKQFANSLQDVHYLGDEEAGETWFKLVPIVDESGKVEVLEELLDERGILEGNPGEKVVIFSQFKEFVNAIYTWLEGMQIPALRITGDVKDRDRDEAVRAFQEDELPAVMLMTTTAGGVSITLDRADSVIFLDETWSPADMEQAEDRVHRVSRIHNVTVYTLRSRGTVDEYINQIVRDKRSIHNFVMRDRDAIRLR